MPIGDTVRLVVRGRLYNQIVMFGQHFRFATGIGTMSGLAGDYQTNILPAIVAATNVDLTLTSIEVRDTRSDGPESISLNLTTGNVGTVAGEGLPPQCTAVFQVKTGQKSRRRRGRFFVPGLAEGNSTGGLITGTQLANLTALGTALVTRYGTSGTSADYKMIVFSREDMTASPPRPGTLTTDVTAISVNSTVSTQRRRRLGVGV